MTLRIAMISEHASPAALLGGEDAGGQNVYVDEVARALAISGHQVDVFTRRDSDDIPAVIAWSPGVRIVNVDAGPAVAVRKDDLWQFMPQFRNEVTGFIRRNELKYDIVHGNFWMSGWVANELRRRLAVPAVQIFHALGSEKRRHQGDADTSPVSRIAIERTVVRGVERVIATCPYERDELIREYGASQAKIVTIPLGVDVETFRPVDQFAARDRIGLPTGNDMRVITYIGRIVPRKDVRTVIRALALLIHDAGPRAPRVMLVVVGGATRAPDPIATPELGELQQLAAELGIQEHVVFAGMRQKSELRDYYCAGDFAVTTPWYEPFGLTPLEAMACGRPVVGSAVGGIKHTVQHRRTGLLVSPRDPVELASAFAELLGDDARRIEFGIAARRRVLDRFTWPLVAQRTDNLYRQVIVEQNRLRNEVIQPSWTPLLGEAALGD